MPFRKGAIAILLGLALTGCLFKGAECPKKKYEAPDERFVFFALGKTEIPADGQYAIGYVAAQLDADPALRVLVVGHVDPQGRADANRDLSLRRARAVRKVLVDHGVKDDRVRVAIPRELTGTSAAQLSRRADLFVYDPREEDPVKRVGYAIDMKD
jgi:hypothetical protein